MFHTPDHPLPVLIQGGGLAARCCLRLLTGSECQPQPAGDRAHSPLTVLLSNATVQLLRDIFPGEPILDHARQIRHRFVCWGNQVEPVELPHQGWAVCEQDLLASFSRPPAAPATKAAWSILCSRASVDGQAVRMFGSRTARLWRVELRPDTPQDACWIESTSAGWLFLLPAANGFGSLIAVGETKVGDGRLIASRIAGVQPASGPIPASPRVLEHLTHPGWIACGSAALGFDPISGEGAGNAAREAVLASAVLRAIARGGDPKPLLEHYSARLLAGFLRHLELCRPFYESGGSSAWWRSEREQLDEGIAWTRRRLAQYGRPRYQLKGFELSAL